MVSRRLLLTSIVTALVYSPLPALAQSNIIEPRITAITVVDKFESASYCPIKAMTKYCGRSA